MNEVLGGDPTLDDKGENAAKFDGICHSFII